MTGHILFRLNATLERLLPEQRLFLKSDTETRFIRLSSGTQAIATLGGGMLVAWTIIASAILMMDSLGAGSAREQAQRAGVVYEARLNTLSQDRDIRAEEAVRAQQRFNLALAQVSQMQSALLASEDRRKELETGIEVIQKTLRRTIAERDDARATSDKMTLALAEQTGSANTDQGHVRDVEATLQVLTAALGETAQERDTMFAEASAARDEAAESALDLRLMEERNDEIFDQLEDAVSVSMEPLDKMFKSAGLSPEKVLDQVRRGYSGQGGPIGQMTISTKSPGGAPTVEEKRAQNVLEGLDRMNLYRIAASKVPFAMPVKTAVRYTSPFGGRNDPFGRGRRQHEGQDLAGSYAAPIYATADGVVIYAGPQSGYGLLVKIQHDFGIETRYAHMSRVRVNVGDRVSRGDRIGDMGSTGRSTGNHLHYEVRVNGNATNPMTYIKAARDVF
ncbi:MAG: peptidase M23 [Cereibacter sphaeroides]|uniref:Peptidase M23 n=1 Tax=Cereibacter sphaeroides TaxID=1063 RepID=A0A2W5SHX6_CERSP|nr:MAG: peptidase M23 [Cereibacter sphaeroides]